MRARARALRAIGVASLIANVVSAEPLAIIRRDGVRLEFAVEYAVTEQARIRGLMHRRALPARHGMLFDFGRARPVRMWMKETWIPLDMLFIDAQGEVVDIQTGLPHSTAILEGTAPARYVLEINGGEARRVGIAPGDRMVPGN